MNSIPDKVLTLPKAQHRASYCKPMGQLLNKGCTWAKLARAWVGPICHVFGYIGPACVLVIEFLGILKLCISVCEKTVDPKIAVI